MYHNVDDKWMENLLSLPWVSKDMSMIFDTEYKKLRFDIITHAITIVEEWRLRYGFPKVPESAQEVLDAKGETKMRHEMKSELLTKASGKSVDRWVKYVFQGVVEAETMDRVLNSDLEGIRQRVISKLVHV